MKETTTSGNAPAVFLSKANHRRLQEILEKASVEGSPEGGIEILKTKLEQAKVIGSPLPRNFVTMGSLVSIIDLKTSEKLKFTLVYPDQADFEKGRVSVLSPLGASILGHQIGDEPEWEARDEIGHVVIAKVDFQPEAAKTRKI